MPDDFPRPDQPQSCRIDLTDLHVAARLRRRRLQLRLEPQLLDVAIGEQAGTIDRVERGDKRLAASQLYNLAVVLGVGVPYFFADDEGGGDHESADLPATDYKALSEAKRFARAVARIRSPEIKVMIADLMKSLVSPKDIPAISPPAGAADGGARSPEDGVSRGTAAAGANSRAQARPEAACDDPSAAQWHRRRACAAKGNGTP